MRFLAGLLFLLAFGLAVYDCLFGFVAAQHLAWRAESQALPEGDMIPRDAAVRSMRELGLRLKDQHRLLLGPVFLMGLGTLALSRIPPKSRPLD